MSPSISSARRATEIAILRRVFSACVMYGHVSAFDTEGKRKDFHTHRKFERKLERRLVINPGEALKYLTIYIRTTCIVNSNIRHRRWVFVTPFIIFLRRSREQKVRANALSGEGEARHAREFDLRPVLNRKNVFLRRARTDKRRAFFGRLCCAELVHRRDEFPTFFHAPECRFI